MNWGEICAPSNSLHNLLLPTICLVLSVPRRPRFPAKRLSINWICPICSEPMIYSNFPAFHILDISKPNITSSGLRALLFAVVHMIGAFTSFRLIRVEELESRFSSSTFWKDWKPIFLSRTVLVACRAHWAVFRMQAVRNSCRSFWRHAPKGNNTFRRKLDHHLSVA